ncbi:MAG: Flp pilus assembly complex ATPase component TadA [Elusimicrobia bacterium]|nr:Flp pilus assembly complex ATPase component TadA [Elusimicrobiota bacterium]
MPASTSCRDEWLVRMLEKRGLVTPAAAQELRSFPYASTEAASRGLVPADQLAKALWDQYHIPTADPQAAELDKLACSLVPEALCRKHTLVPMRIDGDAIEVMAANPLDAAALDEVRAVCGRTPRPVFGLPGRVEELIGELYGSDTVIYDLLKRLPEAAPVEFVPCCDEDEREAASAKIGTPVIRLANQIIAQAIRLQASDIHVEQEERATAVRYRVDGVLRTVMTLPKNIGGGPLLSRIKIMANLDMADRRRPQDGRAKLRVAGQEIGLRVSTIPTAHGEKAVLRILDARQAQVPLEALGLGAEALETVGSLARSGQGMLLVTGPTGSGKTTTLYSILNLLRSDGVNIVTIEDPIEYRLPGINQIQVNEKAGLGFAAILRSVLRQDPDIIFVGEIRDRETADIAFQAALTGHMVFSTLHTNDAVSTIDRLVDMGVERFKLGPALVGVVSQRLVRRLCPECKGRGCGACNGAGVRGRLALAEVLDLRQPEARRLLAAPDISGFKASAIGHGWLRTIGEDARWHLAAGRSTAEELAPYIGDAPGAEGLLAGGGPARAAPDPARHGTRRVLVVDDNADNRDLAAATLRADGYEIDQAGDGDHALERLRERRPDLILLDLMMPGMDGFAALKRLRGQAETATLPVIVLTAMNEAESQALSLELGADDYISKPFQPRILRARVQALFRRLEY